MPTNALIVSGGGSRGAFAVGAIEALREAGIAFDVVTGTSTGALIAPLVVTDEIQLLRSLYTSVRTDDVIRARGPIEILAKDAVYDSHPLWSLIHSFITPERYDQVLASPVEVFLATVSLQTGHLAYWNPRRGGPDGGPLSRQAFLRAVLASASVPVLMPPVRVRREDGSGDQHVDGGLREIAPLAVAVENGATDLYAIVLSPEVPEREEATYRFILGTLMRTINIFTQEVTLNDVRTAQLYNRATRYLDGARARAAQLLSEEEVEAIFDAPDAENPFAGKRVVNLHLIRPARALPSSGLEFRPLIMAQMMALGREAARRCLDRGPLPPAIASA